MIDIQSPFWYNKDMKSNEEIDKIVEKPTATVGDLIKHLQDNFKPTDKLCFWDEGGAHMECVHVPVDWFEKQIMFKYVKDDKDRRMILYKDSKKKIDEDFGFVSDNDVIIY